jgi:hypothetical protein
MEQVEAVDEKIFVLADRNRRSPYLPTVLA